MIYHREMCRDVPASMSSYSENAQTSESSVIVHFICTCRSNVSVVQHFYISEDFIRREQLHHYIVSVCSNTCCKCGIRNAFIIILFLCTKRLRRYFCRRSYMSVYFRRVGSNYHERVIVFSDKDKET